MTSSALVPCAVGREIGTDVPGWDRPCEAEAEVVVMLRGVLPDRDVPVSLCLEHRELLDALGVLERPARVPRKPTQGGFR